jgi:hypothetical protein
MKSIAEVEAAVNKELQFGELIHLPVVAWAFDMSRAQVGPVPVGVGGCARFLQNGSESDFHLVPANPGFFQMAYVAHLRKVHFNKLTAEQRAEIRQTAGTFGLGVWGPEDTTDWREAALMCEENLFEDLVPLPAEPQENPTDEFCAALHTGGPA